MGRRCAWSIVVTGFCLVSIATGLAAAPGAGDQREQRTCPPCRQDLERYGKAVWVTHEERRVYVCCPGCAVKVRDDWKGYAGILAALGERLEVVPTAERVETDTADADRPEIANPGGRTVCGPCRGGACARPEHRPGFTPQTP